MSAAITVPINLILVGIFRSVKPPSVKLEDMLRGKGKGESASEPFAGDESPPMSSRSGEVTP